MARIVCGCSTSYFTFNVDPGVVAGARHESLEGRRPSAREEYVRLIGECAPGNSPVALESMTPRKRDDQVLRE